jgi:hypothetical protein
MAGGKLRTVLGDAFHFHERALGLWVISSGRRFENEVHAARRAELRVRRESCG